MAKDEERRAEKGGTRPSLSRHLLTGAGLGLYVGIIFRPVAEGPSLWLVLGLSLLSALAVTLLQLRHPEKRAVGRLLPYFLKAWGGFALALAMLELRHVVYDLGGKPLTVLFTTVAGAGLGFIYAKSMEEEA